MSVNLIFIILILEFVLFFAVLYLIISTNDKVLHCTKLLDQNRKIIRYALSELKICVSNLKKYIEENVYSQKLIRKEAKVFRNMLLCLSLRKIFKLTGEKPAFNLLFNMWRFKRVLLFSFEYISK